MRGPEPKTGAACEPEAVGIESEAKPIRVPPERSLGGPISATREVPSQIPTSAWAHVEIGVDGGVAAELTGTEVKPADFGPRWPSGTWRSDATGVAAVNGAGGEILRVGSGGTNLAVVSSSVALPAQRPQRRRRSPSCSSRRRRPRTCQLAVRVSGR